MNDEAREIYVEVRRIGMRVGSVMLTKHSDARPRTPLGIQALIEPRLLNATEARMYAAALVGAAEALERAEARQAKP